MEYILKVIMVKDDNKISIKISCDNLSSLFESYSALKYGMENEGYKIFTFGEIRKEK